MEQYLDLLYNKYHITMFVNIPNYTASPRSILNFRVKSVINRKDETIFDPNFKNSNYIFKIKQSLLGKKVFFNFSFDKDDIFDVKSFEFALCDEGVRWIDIDFTDCIKNEFYDSFSYELILKDTEIIADSLEISSEFIKSEMTQVIDGAEKITDISENKTEIVKNEFKENVADNNLSKNSLKKNKKK
jgi:hypothetical protein